MQLGHHNFSRTTLRLVFIIPLDAGRYAATIIANRDRIIRMDGDVDFRAMTSQGLIDRVIQHFKYQMMQTGAVGRIADIHTRSFSNCF